MLCKSTFNSTFIHLWERWSQNPHLRNTPLAPPFFNYFGSTFPKGGIILAQSLAPPFLKVDKGGFFYHCL
jgi:hypothetical protein